MLARRTTPPPLPRQQCTPLPTSLTATQHQLLLHRRQPSPRAMLLLRRMPSGTPSHNCSALGSSTEVVATRRQLAPWLTLGGPLTIHQDRALTMARKNHGELPDTFLLLSADAVPRIRLILSLIIGGMFDSDDFSSQGAANTLLGGPCELKWASRRQLFNYWSLDKSVTATTLKSVFLAAFVRLSHFICLEQFPLWSLRFLR